MDIIDNTTADEMKAAYQSDKEAIGLKAPNGENLNSFFLDRDMLEALLEDETVTGIWAHLAKNPDAALKEITFVFTPAKPVSNTANRLMTANETGTGGSYGNPPPCPTVCPD